MLIAVGFHCSSSSAAQMAAASAGAAAVSAAAKAGPASNLAVKRVKSKATNWFGSVLHSKAAAGGPSASSASSSSSGRHPSASAQASKRPAATIAAALPRSFAAEQCDEAGGKPEPDRAQLCHARTCATET